MSKNMLGEDKNLKKIEGQLIKLLDYEYNKIKTALEKNSTGNYNQTMACFLGKKFIGQILDSIEYVENLNKN